MSSILDRLMKGLSFGPKPLTYEQEKDLAQNEDRRVRRKLAARQDVRPEILYYLAVDDSSDVRREIAINEKTPRQADVLLARDKDGHVRYGLARKIGQLVPGLSDDEADRLRKLTIETLEILAQDQLSRVRAVLADTLKELTNAPPHVIKKLAQDTELEVSGPVLRYSPQLSDDDLLEIINSGPIQGALIQIAQRHNLGERLSDAIVATDRRGAITSLLGNASAQIREETLDQLIGQAPEIEEWHEPLVRRPHLSLKAAQNLASFVADSLLDVMKDNSDLDLSTIQIVSAEVHRRLDEGPPPAVVAAQKARQVRQEAAEKMEKDVRRLESDGKLTEEVIAKSLAQGDHEFVASSLSVLTAIPKGMVMKILQSESAKAVVALVKKAGLGMKLSMKIQKDVANIPDDKVIRPVKSAAAAAEENGDDCPLSEDESDWQLGAFQHMSGGPVDPDWAADSLTRKPGPVDPDWDEDSHSERGPVDPQWSSSERKSMDDEDLEPDWAHDGSDRKHPEKDALDWESDEESSGEPDLKDAGEEELSASERAKKLQDEGRLDEKQVSQAIKRNDRAFVSASLSLMAGLTSKIVGKIISSKSPIAITALAWKAGLSMGGATTLQAGMGHVAPDKILSPTSDGGYPVEDSEMEWQIEFYEE